MFCIVYEFKVNEENIAEFEQIWHGLTLEIKNKSGGLGSRLHKITNEPYSYLAYAQWPDKATWEQFAPLNVAQHEVLTQRLRNICSHISIAYQLEVVDDLLEHQKL